MKNWFNVIWSIILIIASWIVNGCISQMVWSSIVIPVVNDIGYTLPDVKTACWVLLWAVLYIVCMRPNKKSSESEIDIDKMTFKLLMNWVFKFVYTLIAIIITGICF